MAKPILPVSPVRPATAQERIQPATQEAAPAGETFAAALGRKLALSNHAAKRLANDTRDPAEAERVHRAVETMAEKGSRTSVVMLDELSLVVSITNRTVITAVDEDREKGGYFTNIDSAIKA